MKKSLGLGRIFKMTQGDTIVEVMIAMAVLAVVVGAAYAMSARSYQSGINSQYRDQAVSYAQQQLELIKEADNGRPSTIASYTSSPGTPFCINPSNKTKQAVSSGNCRINSQYTESVVYDNSTKTFKVTTSWTSADNQPQQSTLYYRANNSFAGNTVACTTPSASCVSTVTAPPSVGVSAANPQVAVGATDSISWNLLNVKTGSCTASGPGGFGSIDPNTAASPYTTTALNTVGDNTFGVSCTDNAGHPLSGSAVVTVLAPKPTATTGSASAVTHNSATLNGSVNPNGYATTYVFKYGTSASYGSQTAAQSAGAGSSYVAASANLTSLASGTVYHYQICATSAYGTGCGGDATLTTANPLPPTVSTYSPSSPNNNWPYSTSPGTPPGCYNGPCYTTDGPTYSQTFNGAIDPHGLTITSCYFNYSGGGTSKNISCAQALGSSPISVSARPHGYPEGLFWPNAYTVKLCAGTSAGTVCGSTVTASTPSNGWDCSYWAWPGWVCYEGRYGVGWDPSYSPN